MQGSSTFAVASTSADGALSPATNVYHYVATAPMPRGSSFTMERAQLDHARPRLNEHEHAEGEEEDVSHVAGEDRGERAVATVSPLPHSTTTPHESPASSATSPLHKSSLAVSEKREYSGGRVKKYACPYEGCQKRFTRPTRLEEHVRSHTGERPFKCPDCPSAFLRASHLRAHARTHAPADDPVVKPFACDRSQECIDSDKRFFTAQHLRKHVETVHEGGKSYACETCGESFRKHHLLRAHVASEHAPPGTKPFPCRESGCGRSFAQHAHLKAHMRTHDPKRYLCARDDCIAIRPALESRQFATWSALRAHVREAHARVCPRVECPRHDRPLASARALRDHLSWHAELDQDRERLEREQGAQIDLEPFLSGRKRRARNGRRRKAGRADVFEASDEAEQEQQQQHDGDDEQARGQASSSSSENEQTKKDKFVRMLLFGGR